MWSFLFSFFLFSCSLGEILEKSNFLPGSSRFRPNLSGVNRTSECERRYNNDGAWADKQFDATNNNITENDSDFFLHTLFLTSVKTHFLQTISELYQKCLNSTNTSYFPSQAGQQVYTNLLRSNGTGNGTLYCNPINRTTQCATGSECSPNGVNLHQWIHRIDWPRPRLSPIRFPARIRRKLILSYCRPILVNADLDEMSFEKSWPLIQKIVGDPGENFENMEGMKVVGKGMKQETSVDFGSLQMAFQIQSIDEAANVGVSKNLAGRRKRNFGVQFKRWLGKAIGYATAFVKIGKLFLGLFG